MTAEEIAAYSEGYNDGVMDSLDSIFDAGLLGKEQVRRLKLEAVLGMQRKIDEQIADIIRRMHAVVMKEDS